MVGCWAKYGVRAYPFSGKYTETYGYSVPMVYDYVDCNGTCDQYCLRSIYHVTTGQVIMWTYSQSVANKVAELLNKELKDEHH